MSKNKQLDFRAVRKRNASNRALQIILALCLALMLNLIATSHFIRNDLTGDKRFSLSPETQNFLEGLQQSVEVYITLPDESKSKDVEDIYNDIEKLLKEYSYASYQQGESVVTYEFVDLYRQRKRAQELAQRYGLTKQNMILVVSGDKKREVVATDMYEIIEGEPTAFKGEQVFTSAIMDVTSEDENKVYFTVGHGEMLLDNTDPARGLSTVHNFLRERNIIADRLELVSVEDIPEDADAVVIASPMTQLQRTDVLKLRRYLSDRNGRVIVYLDPQHRHGLDDLFYEWGILADEMVVLDVGPDFRAEGGDLIIRNYGEHPIVDFLYQNHLTLLAGLCQVVRPDPGAPIDERLTTTSLIGSSQSDDPEQVTSWGERNWRQRLNMRYDPMSDLRGPVSIATIAERSTGSGLGVDIPGGRLMVYGNADLISNNYFAVYGNSILFYNSMNWMLDTDSNLNIPPKRIQNYKLTLSIGDFTNIGLSLLIPPAFLGLAGLLVWGARRR